MEGCFRRLTSQNLVISRRFFAEDAKEIYKELQHMCRTIVLLLLLSDIAVAVVVFLNSLLSSLLRINCEMGAL